MIDLKLFSRLVDEAIERQTQESIDAFFDEYSIEAEPETDLEKQVTSFMGVPTSNTSYKDVYASFRTPCADAKVKNTELLSSLVPEDSLYQMAA